MSPSDAPVPVLYESSVQLLVDYATERFNDDSVEFAARAAYWDMAMKIKSMQEAARIAADAVYLEALGASGGQAG